MRREEKYHHLQQHQNHHRLLRFHLHAPHLGHKHGHEKGKSPATSTMPAKGWVRIRVGREGEEQQRFEVPVEYLNHPLFVGLLHQAEEEFGFEHNGAITIPCSIDRFRCVRDIIDRDSAAAAAAPARHHGHRLHLAGCFRA